MANRIYSFMGLAKKAGKLISGEDTCERAIKKGKVFLVIVAEDASQNTKKNFTDACSYRNITMRTFGQKELIGKYTGKDIRAVVSILDSAFANKLVMMIDGTDLQNGGGIIGKI